MMFFLFMLITFAAPFTALAEENLFFNWIGNAGEEISGLFGSVNYSGQPFYGRDSRDETIDQFLLVYAVLIAISGIMFSSGALRKRN